MTVTNYQQLYYSTDELIKKFKPALTSYFSVFIPGKFGKADNDDINFLAYEAVLPGTSLETGQVFGDRQGITEQYANKRVYPPVDVSFYIDQDYKVIEFFEQWISTIAPNRGNSGNVDSYTKFQYPNRYETNVIITKFEKNFRSPSQRLVKDGVYSMPGSRVEYKLLNAYPINLISIPVSYSQSDILRTTVTFNYDVYRYTPFSDGKQIGGNDEDGTRVIGPGGDTGTLGELNNQVRLINQNIPTTGLNPNPGNVG
jgi:hypothetical protein